MLSVFIECHYAECHYTQCDFTECHYAECRYTECHYSECHYAECHYAVRHCAECDGAPNPTRVKIVIVIASETSDSPLGGKLMMDKLIILGQVLQRFYSLN